jgi:hypothetical protein
VRGMPSCCAAQTAAASPRPAAQPFQGPTGNDKGSDGLVRQCSCSATDCTKGGMLGC